jgi:hypothetical protein
MKREDLSKFTKGSVILNLFSGKKYGAPFFIDESATFREISNLVNIVAHSLDEVRRDSIFWRTLCNMVVALNAKIYEHFWIFLAGFLICTLSLILIIFNEIPAISVAVAILSLIILKLL